MDLASGLCTELCIGDVVDQPEIQRTAGRTDAAVRRLQPHLVGLETGAGLGQDVAALVHDDQHARGNLDHAREGHVRVRVVVDANRRRVHVGHVGERRVVLARYDLDIRSRRVGVPNVDVVDDEIEIRIVDDGDVLEHAVLVDRAVPGDRAAGRSHDDLAGVAVVEDVVDDEVGPDHVPIDVAHGLHDATRADDEERTPRRTLVDVAVEDNGIVAVEAAALDFGLVAVENLLHQLVHPLRDPLHDPADDGDLARFLDGLLHLGPHVVHHGIALSIGLAPPRSRTALRLGLHGDHVRREPGAAPDVYVRIEVEVVAGRRGHLAGDADDPRIRVAVRVDAALPGHDHDPLVPGDVGRADDDLRVGVDVQPRDAVGVRSQTVGPRPRPGIRVQSQNLGLQLHVAGNQCHTVADGRRGDGRHVRIGLDLVGADAGVGVGLRLAVRTDGGQCLDGQGAVFRGRDIRACAERCGRRVVHVAVGPDADAAREREAAAIDSRHLRVAIGLSGEREIAASGHGHVGAGVCLVHVVDVGSCLLGGLDGRSVCLPVGLGIGDAVRLGADGNVVASRENRVVLDVHVHVGIDVRGRFGAGAGDEGAAGRRRFGLGDHRRVAGAVCAVVVEGLDADVVTGGHLCRLADVPLDGRVQDSVSDGTANRYRAGAESLRGGVGVAERHGFDVDVASRVDISAVGRAAEDIRRDRWIGRRIGVRAIPSTDASAGSLGRRVGQALSFGLDLQVPAGRRGAAEGGGGRAGRVCVAVHDGRGHAGVGLAVGDGVCVVVGLGHDLDIVPSVQGHVAVHVRADRGVGFRVGFGPLIGADPAAGHVGRGVGAVGREDAAGRVVVVCRGQLDAASRAGDVGVTDVSLDRGGHFGRRLCGALGIDSRGHALSISIRVCRRTSRNADVVHDLDLRLAYVGPDGRIDRRSGFIGRARTDAAGRGKRSGRDVGVGVCRDTDARDALAGLLADLDVASGVASQVCGGRASGRDFRVRRARGRAANNCAIGVRIESTGVGGLDSESVRIDDLRTIGNVRRNRALIVDRGSGCLERNHPARASNTGHVGRGVASGRNENVVTGTDLCGAGDIGSRGTRQLGGGFCRAETDQTTGKGARDPVDIDGLSGIDKDVVAGIDD